MTKHYIIYIPGLGDSRTGGQALALRFWSAWGVRARLVQMNWADTGHFNPKLQTILDTIDSLVHQGYTVSLVGVSAGASAALNAYAQRLDSIHSVTLVCGQILGGHNHVRPQVYAANRAFGESMRLLDEKTFDKLNAAARGRITSIHPIADRVVPVGDTKLPGARWRQIPTMGHAFSIGYSLTIGSYRIVRDIKKLPGQTN